VHHISDSMRSTLLCGVGGDDHRFAAETGGWHFA
jgi:hypothetical protein